MRLLTSCLIASALLFTACVHRPYYREVVGTDSSKKEIRVRLVDHSTGQPIPDAPINIGSGSGKISVVTDKSGVAVIPVKKAFLDPYTVVEVIRPPNVARYDLERLVDEQPAVKPSTQMTPPAQETSTATTTTGMPTSTNDAAMTMDAGT